MRREAVALALGAKVFSSSYHDCLQGGKKHLVQQTGRQSGMCLDTTAECHGKTERRGGTYQIRMEKHVGTAHGKTPEVQECRATTVQTLFGLLICQQIQTLLIRRNTGLLRSNLWGWCFSFLFFPLQSVKKGLQETGANSAVVAYNDVI